MSRNTGAVNPTQPVQPATSLHEAIQLARRPFTAAAVKWKVQVNPKEKSKPATLVAFIDARLAGERLNAVGLPFSTKYTPVNGGLLCTISAKIGEDEVERSDVGWSEGTGDNMKLKTLYSDAFKRAAVHFGVGVSIYALPLKQLYEKDGHIRVSEYRGKLRAYLTPKGEKALADHYAAWLRDVGIKQFGDPIDHGDVEGAQGDIESADRVESSDDLAQEPTAAPAAKPKAEKPAEEPKAPVAMSAAQAKKVFDAMIVSLKTADEVKTFLTSKGIESIPEAGTLADFEEFLSTLDADTGKSLYIWCRKSQETGK